MPELMDLITDRLLEQRLPELDLGAGRMQPHYAGGSILNIPPSICHWLGVPPFGQAALFPELLNAFDAPVQRVIVLLVDGLGLSRMQPWLNEDKSFVWNDLIREGVFAPLTSIVPSTTSTAMTSLWTGRSPAEHGIVGYELFLKEYGLVANMIQHKPMSFKEDSGGLRRAGFSPPTFLGLPTLGSHLAAHGVQAYAFQHYSIARSGLSQMFLQDVESRTYGSPTNLWLNLRDLLHAKADERQYIWVYWSEVDHYSHSHGPDDERTLAEFRAFSRAFKELLLDALDPQARQDTLLILAADHGQIATPKDRRYELRRYPDLTQRLHLNPTGENRLAYLYPRPGELAAVQEIVERTWPGGFTALDPAEIVKQGLLGPGTPHPQLLDRMGDLALLARDEAYLWWSQEQNPLLGRHGGLSPDEMLVPFLGVRLG